MRWIIVLACWVLGTAINTPPPGGSRVVFGARISIGHNSQLTSFIALRYSTDGLLKEKKIFTRDEFIKVLSGFWPSPFNPQRINYFEQEKVFGGVYVNDTLLQKVPYCPALDSLWKVRYSLYPFKGVNEEGWSNGQYKPTPAQERYLIDRYGIKHLDQDYFIDTSFWKLLRDVSDSTWVANYHAMQ